MKNTQSTITPIKNGKEIETMYCLGCKDYTRNFKPQGVKMINKAPREKSNCVVCRSSKSGFLKQKYNNNKKFSDIIKENEGFLSKVQKKYWKFKLKEFKVKDGKLIKQSKCTECGLKKSRFVKNEKQKDYWVT